MGISGLVGASLGLGWAPAAVAFGGLFGDAEPPASVDQTGHDVIFVLHDDAIETHIQLHYDPRSQVQNFAWIIPVTAVPEFAVGSDLLFDAVLDATGPTFSQVPGEMCGGGGGGSTGAVGLRSIRDTGSDGPGVVREETVGVFEVAVLDGGTVAGVLQWLGDNGYAQDPAAEPILAQYLAEGHLFVALKLRSGATRAEVHPVVLRVLAGVPTVPLRLARIAAQDDMNVRVMFLGERRMVPTNYQHVQLNSVRVDWVGPGAGYPEVVRQAIGEVDTPGRGFVTEFAGSRDGVDLAAVSSSDWDETAFARAEAVAVVDLLAGQGLAQCSVDGGCSFSHPLVRGLLVTYLPAPDGVDEEEFWGCLSCYASQIDLPAWDPAAFAAVFSERIVEPGIVAEAAVREHPWLTRMVTRISPAEMMEDPRFHPHPDPEPPSVTNRLAAVVTAPCDVVGSVYTLPDERQVYVPDGIWPDIAGMPFAETIEQMPYVGPPQAVVRNASTIDELLEAHNAMNGWPPGGDDSGGSSGGDSGGHTTDSGADPGPDAGATATCACRGGGVAFWSAWLVPLLRRRRRWR